MPEYPPGPRDPSGDPTLYPPRGSRAARPSAPVPVPPPLPPLRGLDQPEMVTPTVRVRRMTQAMDAPLLPAARRPRGSADTTVRAPGEAPNAAPPNAAPPAPHRLGWRRPPNGRPRRKWLRYVVSAVLAIILILSALTLHRLADFGGAISNQASFSTQTGWMTGPNRVNVVILGYGGAGHDGAYLTDSMMVMSVIPDSGSTTMISVPRDLWVQVPPNSGQYGKINSAYQDGLQNGYDGTSASPEAGGAEVTAKVSDVLGMSVPYWVTVDFSGFRTLVDALGGVEVNVPVAFTANYPINDDPAINAGWKVIHFNSGPQHMDGEQAIEYARARYVTSPLSQASDFARSQRQTILIRAILSRARQVSAWPGFLNALDALQHTIRTNLSLSDLMLFAQRMDMNGAARIGLSDQNVLVDSQSSDGQDILLPQNGDWSTVAHYIQAHLKS